MRPDAIGIRVVSLAIACTLHLFVAKTSASGKRNYKHYSDFC